MNQSKIDMCDRYFKNVPIGMVNRGATLIYAVSGFVRETEKAYLLLIYKTEAWFPKSQVVLSEDKSKVAMQKWLAESKGLEKQVIRKEVIQPRSKNTYKGGNVSEEVNSIVVDANVAAFLVMRGFIAIPFIKSKSSEGHGSRVAWDIQGDQGAIDKEMKKYYANEKII